MGQRSHQSPIGTYTSPSAPPCLHCPGSHQSARTLPSALLSKAAGRSSSSPSSPARWWCRAALFHPRCRQLVIQQDGHNSLGSWRKACGVWMGRGQRSDWKPVCVCSGLALRWPIVLIKAYFTLCTVDRVFQKKALWKPQTLANSNCFSSAYF